MTSGSVRLPAELWLQVFLALNSDNERTYSHCHNWFEPRHDAGEELRREARRMNVTVALVCRDWNALIRPWLSRDVVLSPKLTHIDPENVQCMF
jgi:hypothetical protein